MHGGVWVLGVLLCLAFLQEPKAVQLLFNLLLGILLSNLMPPQCAEVAALLMDLIAVGILKGTLRRPRPPWNRDDMLLEAPAVDKFACPSGHTSRSAMLAAILVAFTLSLLSNRCREEGREGCLRCRWRGRGWRVRRGG